jgi:hypothetical protein
MHPARIARKMLLEELDWTVTQFSIHHFFTVKNWFPRGFTKPMIEALMKAAAA